MKNGSIGEIATQLEFMKMGYEVYSPATDNARYDFIAHKDGKLYKVEVKSTSRKVRDVWKVQLKKVHSNRSSNRIANFDNTLVDFLSVYIEPLEKVIILKAKDVTSKTEFSLRI